MGGSTGSTVLDSCSTVAGGGLDRLDRGCGVGSTGSTVLDALLDLAFLPIVAEVRHGSWVAGARSEVGVFREKPALETKRLGLWSEVTVFSEKPKLVTKGLGQFFKSGRIFRMEPVFRNFLEQFWRFEQISVIFKPDFQIFRQMCFWFC